MRTLASACCLLALVMSVSFAAQASAATEVFREGSFTYAQGARHSLYEVSARLLSSGGSTNQVCVNALDDNGSYAGDTRCAGTSAGALATHPYCNCTFRRGVAFSFYGQIPVNARAREDF